MAIIFKFWIFELLVTVIVTFIINGFLADEEAKATSWEASQTRSQKRQTWWALNYFNC